MSWLNFSTLSGKTSGNIISNSTHSFSFTNPALAYSEAKQFLAYKDDEIVGRIAVMINHKEAQELGIEKVRFGWLDFIDDEAVSKALIDTAIAYAKEKNIGNTEKLLNTETSIFIIFQLLKI